MSELDLSHCWHGHSDHRAAIGLRGVLSLSAAISGTIQRAGVRSNWRGAGDDLAESRAYGGGRKMIDVTVKTPFVVVWRGL